jgi:hypothetical protein
MGAKGCSRGPVDAERQRLNEAGLSIECRGLNDLDTFYARWPGQLVRIVLLSRKQDRRELARPESRQRRE